MANPSIMLNSVTDPREREAGEALIAVGVPGTILERTRGNWLQYLKYIPEIIALLERIFADAQSGMEAPPPPPQPD